MESNKIKIEFWHDSLSSVMVEKLNSMGLYWSGNEMMLNMTIGEFADKWNDKFMAYPYPEKKYWVVCLTKYSTFNTR